MKGVHGKKYLKKPTNGRDFEENNVLLGSEVKECFE